MSAWSLVPGWAWVLLGVLVVVGAAAAGVLWWAWLASTGQHAAGPVRLDATPPALRESMGLEDDPAYWDRPLFVPVAWLGAPDDLGPGAGFTPSLPGYNSHLRGRSMTPKVDGPVPDDLPREEGAGGESGPCGVTAPPGPWAELDEFMATMRAEHEAWLASARERWAAA